MSTTKGQRIGIWVIVAFMIVGTIGSFAVIVLANKNSASDTARIQKMEEQYRKEYASYQEKIAAQAKELSTKYFDAFNAHAGLATPFDGGSVKDMSTEDIVQGDGDVLNGKSTFHAYYLGWTPDGKVFDGSIDGDSLKAPYEAAPGAVIEGWHKGIDGMKVGGIRVITIPAELAYGQAGSGDNIPPNTPLRFLIMTIPAPEVIAAPGIPEELYKYYQSQQGSL